MLFGNSNQRLGLGTYALQGDECIKVIRKALELGYRSIDTASIYDNHADVGVGIKGFAREELFITSKLWIENFDFSSVEKSVRREFDLACSQLNLDYLDLYLIHWPDRLHNMNPILETFVKLKEEGRLRSFGVCNFTVDELQELNIPIDAHQFELHPYLFQKELVDYGTKKGIETIAYRPLGKGVLVDDETILEIGKKHGKTASQIILRWILDKGVAVIPKASSEKHLRENIELAFSLDADDTQRIDGLNRNLRYCKPEWWS